MVLLAINASAADGYWSKAGGGRWIDASNWDGGDIADGSDDTAYFGVLADAPPNAMVTLDGPRTIGHLFFTDQSGADQWTLNSGTGGALTLDATFELPSVTIALPGQRVIVNPALAGTAGLEKLGAGTLTLAGTNLYTGQTVVSAGTLLINGQEAGSALTVSGGAVLGGTGVITGAVIVQSGGTLSPGEPVGALTMLNTLTLEPGSRTRVRVNAATAEHDTVRGLAQLSLGGTLEVTNLAGALVAGQTFAIFSSTNTSGNFTNVTPNPGPWLRWRLEASSGVLAVVSSASSPRISSIALAGLMQIIKVSDGPPGSPAFLLTTTDLASPLTNWTTIATNAFDVSGYTAFTNAVLSNRPQQFYRVSAFAGP